MVRDKVDFLLKQMEYRYNTEDWFAPLCNALEGLTAKHAAWRPDGTSVNTIWQIVNHLVFWTEATVTRMSDNWTFTVDDNDATFGQPGNPDDEDGWRDTVQRLHAVYATFKEKVEALTDEDLMHEVRQGRPLQQALMSVIMHDAYHTGQIYTMRKLQGLA